MCKRRKGGQVRLVDPNMIFSPAEVFFNERGNLELISGLLVKVVWNVADELHPLHSRHKVISKPNNCYRTVYVDYPSLNKYYQKKSIEIYPWFDNIFEL